MNEGLEDAGKNEGKSAMVAIGAHHDDVELRSGGTLARQVRQVPGRRGRTAR